MTLRRLPDSEQYVDRPRCPDDEHNPPSMVDTSVIEPGSYVHTCPTCGVSVRVEVSAPGSGEAAEVRGFDVAVAEIGGAS